ncbi:hypothetical protein DPMN_135861 [Dreissena polymorpha]|uniref:Uncharacterized protein n=1 Tax=Dreissena polymorpha TaxID=45954 RepID=A0A9D4JH90_DREPO|nr:hypothetical protein DPMN_135861 [Dreissena polymorpha]
MVKKTRIDCLKGLCDCEEDLVREKGGTIEVIDLCYKRNHLIHDTYNTQDYGTEDQKTNMEVRKKMN